MQDDDKYTGIQTSCVIWIPGRRRSSMHFTRGAQEKFLLKIFLFFASDYYFKHILLNSLGINDYYTVWPSQLFGSEGNSIASVSKVIVVSWDLVYTCSVFLPLCFLILSQYYWFKSWSVGTSARQNKNIYVERQKKSFLHLTTSTLRTDRQQTTQWPFTPLNLPNALNNI